MNIHLFAGLEKNPLYEVTQFQPAPDGENNKLAGNAETILEAVMQRLAARVRIKRIQVRTVALFLSPMLLHSSPFLSVFAAAGMAK